MKCIKCGKGWLKHIKKCQDCGGDLTVLSQITCVNATEMPSEAIDYCVEREISTHYQNDIIFLENDGNPFAKWLISNGYKFKSKYDAIGIIAT